MLFNLEPVRWRSSVWADTEQDASDGLVKDPLTGRVMDKNESWDILDEHNDPSH